MISLAGLAATLLAGALIGATGIGGVLLVPVLTQLEGLDVARAVAASSLAFAFPAVAALWWLRQGRGADTAHSGWALVTLVVGGAIGALIGSLLVHRIQSFWLFFLLALLAVGSGLRGLLLSRQRGPQALASAAALEAPAAPFLGLPAWAALGLGVGLASALTGTGGPVILIPLLTLWRLPLRQVVACAQAIQLPVAMAASAVHVAAGALDVPLACGVGLVLLAGSLAGQWLARRAALGHLQLAVNLLLLATGLWFAWRLFV